MNPPSDFTILTRTRDLANMQRDGKSERAAMIEAYYPETVIPSPRKFDRRASA